MYQVVQRSLQHAEHEKSRMQRLCRHQQLSLLALKLLLRSQQHDQEQGLGQGVGPGLGIGLGPDLEGDREVGEDEGKIQGGEGGVSREDKHLRY